MSKYIKPKFTRDELGPNLFLNQLKIPVNKIVMHGQYKPDKDGDHLPVELDVERDQSCRVYVDADRRKQMVMLTPRGKDLLIWLIYEAENGCDFLWLNHLRYMEECKVSSYNTYKSALKELILKSFIQKTVVQHVYFINPHFFFNGNRVSKFPKNVIKK